MGEEDKKLNRRDWLTDSFKVLGRSLFELVNQSINNTMERASGGQRYLRPPGAIDETAFMLSCERCGKCADACPTKAIQILGTNAGAAVGTPYIDPFHQYCDMSLECVKVCPSGALSLITDKRKVKIGVAVLNEQTCWAHNGTLCDVCYQRCPFPDEAIEMRENKPYILPDACTGCGLCAYVCVNTPSCIRIEPV